MLNLRRTTVVLLTVDIIDVNDLDPQFGEFNNTIVIFEGLSVVCKLVYCEYDIKGYTVLHS